jgi:hypothetical protein
MPGTLASGGQQHPIIVGDNVDEDNFVCYLSDTESPARRKALDFPKTPQTEKDCNRARGYLWTAARMDDDGGDDSGDDEAFATYHASRSDGPLVPFFMDTLRSSRLSRAKKGRPSLNSESGSNVMKKGNKKLKQQLLE